MLLGLRTAIYPVPDIVAAKRWYSAMLEQEPYFDEPYYVGFSVGGFELGLIPDGEQGTAGPQALWGVPSAAAAWERLLSLGASPLEPVIEVGNGIKVGSVRDPFGNRFDFIENPNFDVGAVR